MAVNEYHDPGKAKDLLFDMFLTYVKDVDFGSLSGEQRIEAVNIVDEFKNSIDNDKTI